MAKAMNEAKARGVTHVIFGDLFLQDIRDYRERQLEASVSRRSFRYGSARPPISRAR